jgi:vacuolar-type H+-ATPase subunit I/STV1
MLSKGDNAMNNKNAPSGTKTFFYIASWLVIIAYIVGALYSTFVGIGFMFSTDRGIEGFLLYNVLLGMLVIPVILIIASFIYIVVYLDKWK